MNNQLIHQLETNQHPIQKAHAKMKRRVRKIGQGFKTPLTIFVMILFGMFLAGYTFYKITIYTNTHKFIWHSPIEIKVNFFMPLKIKERKEMTKDKEKVKNPVILTPTKIFGTPTVTPRPRTEKEIILAQKHGEVLLKIYQLESSSGKNDYCRNNKLGWGGFGVMDRGSIVCYKTFELAASRANFWLGKLEPEKNLVSALCAYNLGTKGLVNCVYAQHYNSL